MASVERSVIALHPAWAERERVEFSLVQHIFESVKHSLERLQLDYVDVLQCMPSHAAVCRTFILDRLNTGHRFDNDTPIEETVLSIKSVHF